MVIQRAQKEEIHEIKKLLTETWINTYNEIYSPDTIKNITSQWHKPELLIVQIQDPDVYFGLAKEQDKIVGLITVRRENNDNLTMYRLYIHPNFQRQGIGTKLIQEALKVFKGCKKLNIEVEQQNMKGVSANNQCKHSDRHLHFL